MCLALMTRYIGNNFKIKITDLTSKLYRSINRNRVILINSNSFSIMVQCNAINKVKFRDRINMIKKMRSMKKKIDMKEIITMKIIIKKNKSVFNYKDKITYNNKIFMKNKKNNANNTIFPILFISRMKKMRRNKSLYRTRRE